MSVEGMPTVGDVADAVRSALHGPPVDCRGLTALGSVRARENAQARRITEAVHALYAPHLAEGTRTEYRVLTLSSGSYEPCVISHIGADILNSRSTADNLAASVREKGWADRVWVEERRVREAGDWVALTEPKEQD